MAQFDVYVNTDQDSNKIYPYFIDIQNDLLGSLNSRVVIPLTPIQETDKTYPKHLCPVIDINNKKFAVLTYQLTSVGISFLQQQETSLAASRDDIVAAIDFLVTGI
jgi:toxin CcdB